MTATTLALIILGAFSAGTILGFIAAAIFATGRRADEYDPIQYPPEPRVSTQIFDGLAKRRTDT